ncbi:glycosyl hydrolase family 18 protein [Flavobacteriaceae bacterium]|nr:glycosyl hydrolase family 18 protein [Flavobacteriaceae bacterium]MDA9213006.1 glycosyl hydrolase family 18 protein [Flavobacteriaceae bacterium]MDB4013542.1 glycosyl hydrolase family 18 protein [Flavobacteriaceae bacterium]MDB4131702.1 glycosyl hydrolase family 18 protein [Flavobacteriaceae bacterium]MDC3301275.1 glycosyl hydrolase family 18 protein [Flavobacteriaceae bacterium]
MFKRLLFLCIVILVSCSKDDSFEEEIMTVDKFARVVGYLPSYRFDSNEKIDYCKLTHLNLAFANPGSNGKLIINDFSGVVVRARNENSNIKIYISIGGGYLTDEQASIWSNSIDIKDNRPIIINEIVNFVVDNSLDGVDVDLEWQYVTSGYSDFVIELKSALSTKGKSMTAALPGTTKFDNITEKALQTFDFINIMAYDFTGPWNPTASGQHSSYNNAVESINFWKNTGVSQSKLTLGVPFYGYDFSNSSNVTSFTFGQMISTNNSYSEIDNVGMKYYNGRPTIKSKVKLASEQVSGIMIWELGQDSFSDYSLLKTIHKEYNNLGFKTSGLCLD